MTSANIKRIANVTASTKRSPGMVGSKQGLPAPHLVELKITPLDPANGEYARDVAVRLSKVILKPFVLIETYIDGAPDVALGDVLVVDGVDYPIRNIDAWTREPGAYTHLMLEKSL